jgi:putative FmdB family regulatory protein
VPTYDYQCRDCGNIIEVIHSMLDDGPATCERCGGPLRRIIHPAGIIFKGSGFYKTDSRAATSGSSGSGGSGSSGDASSGPSPSSATTDAKGSTEGSKASGAAASGDSD